MNSNNKEEEEIIPAMLRCETVLLTNKLLNVLSTSSVDLKKAGLDPFYITSIILSAAVATVIYTFTALTEIELTDEQGELATKEITNILERRFNKNQEEMN